MKSKGRYLEKWERVLAVMNHYGLNKNSFSVKIGMSSSMTIGRIINEKRKPINATLNKIADKCPEINRDWLFTGQGEMLKNITEMSEGARPVASEHPSMTSSQIKGKVPENVFTGLTQEQVDKEMKNGIRDVIMEMYEKGEAYPATIVRQYQDQIKELTKQVARLEYQLQEFGLKQTVSAGSLARTGNRERKDESDK